MRRVKFIRSLNIEERTLYDCEDSIRYHRMDKLNWIELGPESAYLETEDTIESVIVPIIKLYNSFYDPTPENPYNVVTKTKFIAYSEEVEEFLEMPFKALHEQIKGLTCTVNRLYDELNTSDNQLYATIYDLNKYTRANVWARIKYLFTGKAPFENETDQGK